jgi:hypothetical protein
MIGKDFFCSIMVGFLFLSVIVVSGITYFKIQTKTKTGLKEGWTMKEIGYDTNFVGGLGWGKGFGDWEEYTYDFDIIDKGNGQEVSWGNNKNWKVPGWSVLFKPEKTGGTGIDRVFHKTSLEGEFVDNLDTPTAEETNNRLGGGWSDSANVFLNYESENSMISPSGKMDDSYGKINGDLTFYAPGSFMYGADNYVPSYAESVLLSPMIGVNAPLKPIVGEGQGNQMETENSPCSSFSGASVLDKESYCQKLNVKDAGDEDCCVVLGGEVPMAGNDQGPYNRAIYTNPLISSAKDYYFHKGKCYGNCPGSYSELAQLP